MEGLIIFILVAIVSGISNYLQKRRQSPPGGAISPPTDRRARPSRGEPPVPHWPATGRDWQEELRRLLQGENQPPRIPPQASTTTAPPVPPRIAPAKPVLPTSPVPVLEKSEGELTFPTPLKQSTSAYTRASQIAEQVESRMELIDRETAAHRPTALLRRPGALGAATARRLTRSRQNMREAFIGSLIFSPPVALENEKQ